MKKKLWRLVFKMIGKGPICITDGHLHYQAKGTGVFTEKSGEKVYFARIGCRRHFCPWEKYVEVKNDIPKSA